MGGLIVWKPATRNDAETEAAATAAASVAAVAIDKISIMLILIWNLATQRWPEHFYNVLMRHIEFSTNFKFPIRSKNNYANEITFGYALKKKNATEYYKLVMLALTSIWNKY